MLIEITKKNKWVRNYRKEAAMKAWCRHRNNSAEFWAQVTAKHNPIVGKSTLSNSGLLKRN